ncbi:hypothetical protein AOXY_G14444 [Acipenser oxyrinchus oxyrinchus]|uniref:Mucin-13 n=1 Tax=Acipenser oxyrinchus oxyrinchus TaxID=40147 RepID=A0AAD8D9S8_ACIOX|nr:hypothetical protein AOXY_G14444 [Acipenser oxyrinchus oxyrinchus]
MANFLLLVGSICVLLAIQTASTGTNISSSPGSTVSVTTDTTEASTGNTTTTSTGSTISSSPDSTVSVTTVATEAPPQCTTGSCESLANCVQLSDNYTCQCVFGYYYDVDKCLQGKAFSGNIKHTFDISKDDISSTNSEGYTEIYRKVTSALSSGFNGTAGYKETTVLQIREEKAKTMFGVRKSISVSVDIVNIFSVDSNINKSAVDEQVNQYLNASGIQGYTSKDNCDYFNCNDATSTCKEGDVTPTCECKGGYYKVDLLDKSCMTSTDFEMITIIVGCVSAVIILGLTGGLIAVAIRRKDIEDNKDNDDDDRMLVAKKQSKISGLQNPAMTNSHVSSPFTFPKVQAGSDWNQSSQVKRNGLNPGPPSYPQLGNDYDDDDEENDDIHISNNKGRIGNRGQTNPYNNPYSPGPMKPTQLPRTNGMKYGSSVDYDDDGGYHDIRGSSGMQMKPYNNRAPRAALDYSYPGSRKY